MRFIRTFLAVLLAMVVFAIGALFVYDYYEQKQFDEYCGEAIRTKNAAGIRECLAETNRQIRRARGR